LRSSADLGLDLRQVTLGAAVQRAGHARHPRQLFRADHDERHHADNGELGKTKIDH
jgi:hypothetical protein